MSSAISLCFSTCQGFMKLLIAWPGQEGRVADNHAAAGLLHAAGAHQTQPKFPGRPGGCQLSRLPPHTHTLLGLKLHLNEAWPLKTWN